jgi:hypothetical protein
MASGSIGIGERAEGRRERNARKKRVVRSGSANGGEVVGQVLTEIEHVMHVGVVLPPR